MKFTRRHARALAAGAVTTAAYLAAGKAAGSRPVRVSGLLLLATVATASVQASAIAKTTKKRLDQHISDASGAIHLNNLHGTALTNLANNSANLLTLAGATDVSFLASISGPLAHQTTANNTTFSNANFTGLANAVNTLQFSLQGNNIES